MAISGVPSYIVLQMKTQDAHLHTRALNPAVASHDLEAKQTNKKGLKRSHRSKEPHACKLLSLFPHDFSPESINPFYLNGTNCKVSGITHEIKI